MVKDTEIGWLAGVLDGEGTISLANSKKSNHLHAQLFITNTNLVLLAKAMDILTRLGASPRQTSHKRKGTPTYKSNLPCYRIFVGTALGIRLVLTALLPELTAKAEQAKLMLEFVQFRGRPARKQFTARDFEIAYLIRSYNQGKLSGALTTAREPRVSEMIQSALHGDMQKSAEMTGSLVN